MIYVLSQFCMLRAVFQMLNESCVRSDSFYSKERERDILAAYSLYVDYGHTQENIGKVLNCSKASVSNWVKVIKQSLYKKSVRDDLEDVRDYVFALNIKIKNF